MALVPAVTDITARVAAWTATGFINAMRDHIVADGVHLKVDAYTADEGLAIGFVAAGESQQVNWRKSGAQAIAMSIEPSGSITDPGDSVPTAPTGTTADWSGEHAEPTHDTSLGSPGAGSKVFVVEIPDAFFVVVKDTTNSFHVQIIYEGRIAQSWNSANAAAFGQDGLGFACGVPDNGNGSASDWIGIASPCSTLHWATGEWSDHISWVSVPSTSSSADPAHTSYRPLSPGLVQAVDINGLTSDPNYGPLKYIRAANSTSAPGSILADGASNQGWCIYNDAGTAEEECIIWDKTEAA